MAVELRVAGQLAVIGETGQRQHLESTQAQVAFALLLLERDRGVTRDELANVIWPYGSPPTWASALRNVLSRLRRFVVAAMPSLDQPLVVQGRHYLLRLPDDAVVDIEMAEREIVAAQDALAAGDVGSALRLAARGADRLRSPFLSANDGPWVTSWRGRLTELLALALETASQAAVGVGDNARALFLANEATARSPLRERSYRCLMAAHAAAGNRGEALRAYQRLRYRLSHELGVDPSLDTEAAYLDLLGPAPAPLPQYRGIAAGERSGDPADFVARDAEMAALTDAWATTVPARRHLVFVTGEAGAGKTRLAREAGYRVAAEGGLVLFGRCDRESLFPYQPLVEAFDGYISATPPDQLPDFSPAMRCELSAVFPSLDATTCCGVSTDRAKLFDGVTRLVEGITSQRPAVLILDDLHWADRETLWLVRHLVRHADGGALLVIATARDDLIGRAPLRHLIRGLEREGSASSLPLAGLDRTAITRLAERIAPSATAPDVDAERLATDTAGNPSLVVDLLRGSRSGHAAISSTLRGDDVPHAVRDVLSAKLDATSNAAVEPLLHAAALTHAGFDLPLVATAAGLAPSDALDALDAALAVGLVVESEDLDHLPGATYRFRHEVIRRVIAGQLSAARRRHLHHRLAEAARQGTLDHGGAPT